VEDLEDYRTDSPGRTLYLTRNRGRFVKDFPSAAGSPPPAEKYVITMMNCPFRCRYCYLQVYLEHGRITVFTNTGRLMEEVEEVLSGDPPERITTGEMGDSLVLDRITGTTSALLPLFEGSSVLYEARTKSSNVGHLTGIGERPGAGNLLITWTLSPEKTCRIIEPGTASLADRLKALRAAAAARIKVAVRFDPVIPFFYSGRSYRELIEQIHAASGGKIHRFEIGIMRFPPGLWELIRKKYPASEVMRGEFNLAPDGKIKYYRPERVRIYREIFETIRNWFPGPPVELSMEPVSVWEDAGIPFAGGGQLRAF
jgi:spore photoproduct lyase